MNIEQSIEEHIEIKKALEKGDGILAEKIMLRHKKRAEQGVIRIIESEKE